MWDAIAIVFYKKTSSSCVNFFLESMQCILFDSMYLFYCLFILALLFLYYNFALAIAIITYFNNTKTDAYIDIIRNLGLFLGKSFSASIILQNKVKRRIFKLWV
jgi:hypothetical protein